MPMAASVIAARIKALRRPSGRRAARVFAAASLPARRAARSRARALLLTAPERA